MPNARDQYRVRSENKWGLNHIIGLPDRNDGKCSFGTAALDSMHLLATDVSGGVGPDSGHSIPEERPSFLTELLFAFFGGNTTNTIN